MGFEQLEDCKRADENHVGEATPGQQVDLHLSLVRHAASVLLQPDPHRKADQTRVVANLWKNRQIIAGSKGSLQLCDRPSRDDSRVSVYALMAIIPLYQLYDPCVTTSNIGSTTGLGIFSHARPHSCRSRWLPLERSLVLAKVAVWHQGKQSCTAWCT